MKSKLETTNKVRVNEFMNQETKPWFEGDGWSQCLATRGG